MQRPPPSDPFGHAPASFLFLSGKLYPGSTMVHTEEPRDQSLSHSTVTCRKMEQNINEFMNGATGYRACILEARNALSGMANAPVNDTVLVDNASEAINDLLRNFEPTLKRG